MEEGKSQHAALFFARRLFTNGIRAGILYALTITQRILQTEVDPNER